jgi:SPP1 gp7 family putative phage head morphogenesis protein
MRSGAYWQKRTEQIARRQFQTADEYALTLAREYERAMVTTKRDIEVFYQRFATNNQITLAEARRLLTTGELREFRMTLEEFTAKAKDNADGRWTRELNNVYYRTRVTRFEALQVQIRHQVEMLAGSRQLGARGLLADIYTDTYHRTIFEVQKGAGIGVSFAQIDNQGLEKVLNTEFAGSNWSKRIWGDRDKLAGELQTKLAQSFIRGDSVDRTVKDLTERFAVSRSNAMRLVQTEAAFFTEQATMAGYKASGLVEEYQILATLDSRTSEICQSMDGKVFKVSEQEPGVNAPPFHAYCRTATVPFFPDEIDPGARLARAADGKTYTVPGDMTYEQWHNEHVKRG